LVVVLDRAQELEDVLHVVTQRGKFNLVRALVDVGANVNRVSPPPLFPLSHT
jgi:hypothetical protein